VMLSIPTASAWINIGPDGGVVRAMAASSGAVYVLNTRSGVFRSVDGGLTWIPVFTAPATAIAADEVLYTGTTAGLFRNDTAVTSDAVIAVAAESSRVIVSTLNGLARSSDGGQTWTPIASPPSDVLAQVSLLRFDPRDASHVAAIIAGNLFTSSDFGDSWQKLNAASVVAATFGDVLYAGCSNGVYACASSCTLLSSAAVVDVAYWRGAVVASGPPDAPAIALLATPSTLFAGTTAGVFATRDGARWAAQNDGLTNVRISGLAFASGKLFAATRGQGIMRDDATWTTVNSGLATALASDGSALYAAFAGGLFRSTDGATWTQVSTLPAIDVAASPAIVLVTTAGGTFQLADGQPLDVPAPATHIAIAGDRIYAGTDRGVFVKHGSAWTGPSLGPASAMGGSGNRAFAFIEPASGSDITRGVYFSDDGSHWTFVSGSDALPLDVTSIASDGANVFVGTNGGSIFAAPVAARRRAVR